MEKEIQVNGGFSLSNEAAVALIRKIHDGDKSSLAILYDRTSPLLFGLILKVLENRALAEETLLDAYTHIWKQAASYDPRLLPLEWLTMVARDCAIAKLHWSKQSRIKREFLAVNADFAVTVAPEQQKLVRSSIESLAPVQREILDWVYYSGLSCGEIAAQMGKPLGAIKTHARLGLGKLSDMIRPLFEPETTGGAH